MRSRVFQKIIFMLQLFPIPKLGKSEALIKVRLKYLSDIWTENNILCLVYAL